MDNLLGVIDRNLEITIAVFGLVLETAGATGKRVTEVGLDDEDELTWLEVLNGEE